MKNAKKVIEWLFIGLLLTIVVSFLSIKIYRTVVNSDWYGEMQMKKSFSEVVEKLNDFDNIEYIKVDDNIEERFIHDFPKELFDDIAAESYERVDDIEKLRDIWSQNCVTVFFKNGDPTSFFITDEGEIYWGADLKIKCPSLLEWYNAARYYDSPQDEELLYRRLYVFKDSEMIFKPKFSLFDDGTFQMTFSIHSSYLGIGKYTLADGRLTLKTDDGEYIYFFDAVGDSYVFDAEASSDMVWFSDVTDGAVFE